MDLARYTLQPVRSPREWKAYHAIRRDAIFAALLPGQAYDEHDPDEFEGGRLPHVLVRDGEVIGTVRIDSSAPPKQVFASSPSAAISSAKATAAFCSGSQNKPRAPSAGSKSSSTPTRRR